MIKRVPMILGACLLYGGQAYTADAVGTSECDRECLRGHITRYLDALVRRDPGSLPVAATVKFTQDTLRMQLGEGLWKSASGLRSYRQDFLDVRSGVAGSHVVVEEGGKPVLLVLRLKIASGKITEVETVVVRNEKEGLIFDVDALTVPSKAMNLVPPSSQLHPREETVRIADYYPLGLKAGSFVKVDAPFAADAYRLENGRLMAGPGCTIRPDCVNIKTQPSPERPTLTSRLLAVDEELGIAWYRLSWIRGEGTKLVVWEAFKVYGGQMHAVEAFMELEPPNAGSGWE